VWAEYRNCKFWKKEKQAMQIVNIVTSIFKFISQERFQVLTVVIEKNTVFWEVAP
jgi:hypothetical protein